MPPNRISLRNGRHSLTEIQWEGIEQKKDECRVNYIENGEMNEVNKIDFRLMVNFWLWVCSMPFKFDPYTINSNIHAHTATIFLKCYGF